jgi:hypothetical protein
MAGPQAQGGAGDWNAGDWNAGDWDAGGGRQGETGWEPALHELALRLERLLAEPVRGVPRVELRGESAGVTRGLGFLCELEPLGEPVGVVWRGDLAAGLAQRLMGGGAAEQTHRERGLASGFEGLGRGPGRVGGEARECSPMEAKLLERLSGLVLREVTECLGSFAGLPLRNSVEVVPVPQGQANWHAELWSWSLEVSGPGFQGELQCLLPGCLAEFRPLPEGRGLAGAGPGHGGMGGRGTREHGAGGRGTGGGWQPAVGTPGAGNAASAGGDYEVVLAELELTAEEWGGLAEGDLLVTEREAGCEVEVRGAAGEVWRGEAGVWEGSRVVRVLGRVGDGSGGVWEGGSGEIGGPIS